MAALEDYDWLKAADDIESLMATLWPDMLMQGADFANDRLPSHVSFDLRNPDVEKTRDQLGKEIRGITETTRQDIADLILRVRSDNRDASTGEIAQRIRDFGLTASNSRSKVIANTELARAMSKGALITYKESGVVGETEWLVYDPCPICAPLAGKRTALGGSYGSGFDAPPAHPNCRCALAPVVETPAQEQPQESSGTNEAPIGEAWQNSVDDAQQRFIQKYADEHGWTFDETLERADQHIKEMVDRASMRVRVTPEILESILEDGRFKSIYEAKSSVPQSVANRRKIESDYFGLGNKTPVQARPIYGYLAEGADADNAELFMYGRVSVRLSDALRSRASFMWGDSTAIHESSYIRREAAAGPQGLLDPSARALDWNGKNPWQFRSVNDHYPYVETQIHGGVKATDIHSLRFYGEGPSVALQARLRAMHIQWEVVNE